MAERMKNLIRPLLFLTHALEGRLWKDQVKEARGYI